MRYPEERVFNMSVEIADLKDALKESERVSKSWKAQFEAQIKETERIKKLLYEREEWLGKRRCQYAACPEYARLKEGLEAIVNHLELIMRGNTHMSTTYQIAVKALEGTK